ncbi:MAG: type II toxin-antitoxin system YafQ family toxin [Bacteroidetes bacterium]|nr:type II toxin-antitoxin system YafQ family toxin [Bacteroidota bacterium]
MFDVFITGQFKKDYKKVCRDAGFSDEDFEKIVNLLRMREKLPAEYKDHPLKGNYKDCRELHLLFDLLIIYMVDEPAKKIRLIRLGSHSELQLG